MPVPANAAQVVTAWIGGGALTISILALVIAIFAMRAARQNAGVAVRKELRELAERDDADGPWFEAEQGQVVDRKARVKIRVVGGPGAVAVSVRPADVAWCRGVSSGDYDPADEVWYPPREPGDVFMVTVHLTVEPWQGHTDGVALPLLIDAQSREDRPRRWERRVSAQLLPPPPKPPQPLGVPAADRSPES